MGKLMYQGENLTGAPPLLGSLKDVNITSPSNNDALVYNSTTQKWENGAGGGGSLDIVPVTQAQYNALTPEQKADPTKVYDITDANLVNADIDDTTTSIGKVWSSSKTSSEIQGAGLIHKTQEEYDALPSADKSDPTKHYLITNATLSGAPLDDTAISNGKVWSSDKVNNELIDIQDDLSTLNSALTDVKETVTANELGTYVNISSYTSDWYTCPSDGYIHIRCNTAGTTMQAQITGPTGGVDLYLKAIGASGGVFDSVSVRKGMKVKMIKTGSGDAYGYFVPLE